MRVFRCDCEADQCTHSIGFERGKNEDEVFISSSSDALWISAETARAIAAELIRLADELEAGK